MATRNSESGSGGDINAPSTNAPNHTIRLDATICWRETAPERKISVVMSGA